MTAWSFALCLSHVLHTTHLYDAQFSTHCRQLGMTLIPCQPEAHSIPAARAPFSAATGTGSRLHRLLRVTRSFQRRSSRLRSVRHRHLRHEHHRTLHDGRTACSLFVAFMITCGKCRCAWQRQVQHHAGAQGRSCWAASASCPQSTRYSCPLHPATA